jgi:hypothetical protein
MLTIETEYSDHLKNFALFFGLKYEVEVIIPFDYPVNIKTISIITEIGLN